MLPESLKGRVVDRNLMFTVLQEERGSTLRVPNNFSFERSSGLRSARDTPCSSSRSVAASVWTLRRRRALPIENKAMIGRAGARSHGSRRRREHRRSSATVEREELSPHSFVSERAAAGQSFPAGRLR
jgi:hypothetical protein